MCHALMVILLGCQGPPSDTAPTAPEDGSGASSSAGSDTDADTSDDTDTGPDTDTGVFSGGGWGCAGAGGEFDAWTREPVDAVRLTLYRHDDGHTEAHTLAATDDAAQRWGLELSIADTADAVKADERSLFSCTGDWTDTWAARLLAHVADEAIDCLLLGADPSALADPLCL